MVADAIIFDKDGTLLDFDAFWVTVSVNALKSVLQQLKMEQVPLCELTEALGVHNGVTDINGVLCKGTYAEIGKILHGILQKYGCTASCDRVIRLTLQAYNQNADTGVIKPTCPDLAATLARLKSRGKKLALVTTDNETITRKCLCELGIISYFDKLYTDDGKTPQKPDPYCANAFATFAGVSKDRLVMVGDTMTDMHFAKNAGIRAIGVAKNEENKGVLAPYADAVIAQISQLTEIIG